MIHVGRTLRRIREAADLAASEVSRRARLGRTTVSEAEARDISPLSAKNLAQVLAVLGLSHDQWLMLLGSGWDGSPPGWQRYRIIVAAHMLDANGLSDLHHRAEMLCREAEIQLPNALPEPPPKVEKPSRLVTVRERAKVLPGGHIEEVVRVYEAPADVSHKGPSKKGRGPGQSALPETAKLTAPKARKRGHGAA